MIFDFEVNGICFDFFWLMGFMVDRGWVYDGGSVVDGR